MPFFVRSLTAHKAGRPAGRLSGVKACGSVCDMQLSSRAPAGARLDLLSATLMSLRGSHLLAPATLGRCERDYSL